MKCYIINTLVGIFSIDNAGNLLNFRDFNGINQKFIRFYSNLSHQTLAEEEYSDLLNELKNSGFDEFIFDDKDLESLTSQNFDLKTYLECDSLEFRNFRLNLEEELKKIGLDESRENLLKKHKRINEQLIILKIRQVGHKKDIIIIQIIETLDTLKKTISLFSSRLKEWYGLHFPELTDKIIEDNIILARIVSEVGERNNLTEEFLQNFDISQIKKQNILNIASESMGAEIDLSMVKTFANQILSLDNYRSNLELYLEDLMEEIAPNIKAIVGSLIGAKLIAKSGTLRKLAFMPASRIQLLGAESALYRFLRSGDRLPKHGLIFQWQQIRSSKVYQRGNIARLISGKLAIASKIDYFEGEFIGEELTKEIENKIKEIKEKYPNPPKKIKKLKKD
ncbi:MAG: C/D box methylation guide ribonucleoprotein complex aNOP56 subunit [Candidatus Lokiarchaeota archaeon]|nr:C/D box methylation guide ribonucleoprotein complex aNOP56 subunit [Candidatus Lokiarchaeota archaeon]